MSSTQPPQSDAARLLTNRGATASFTVVLVAGFMTLLDVSIVNVALPSIESALHASAAQIQWIVAGYSLTFGLLLVAAGRLGDVVGRRKLFMIGVAGFIAASLGCGLAPDAMWLTALRLIQGAFAGILNPQILGLIQDLYKGSARAKAFGTYGMMVGVSTAVGPLLGGALITAIGAEHGWRLVFLINVPIGIVLLPLAYRWLPSPSPQLSGLGRSWLRQFDPVGILLLGAVVVCVMWPFLTHSEKRGATLADAPLWLLGAAALVGMVLFFWERIWVRGGGAPLLDTRLMKSPSFMLGVATGFTYFAGFTSIFIVVTLYLQQGLGYTPWQAGLASLPFALLSGIFAGIAGRLVSRFGRNVPIVGSFVIVAAVAGIAAFALWAPAASVPWGVIGLLAVAGLGSGLVISPNQALTLEQAPPMLAGVAAALLQTMQRMGTSIGLAVVTTVFFINTTPGDGRIDYDHGLAMAMLAIGAILVITFVINLIDRFRRGGAILVKEPAPTTP